MKHFLPLIASISAQEVLNSEVPDNGFRTINGELYTQTGLYLRSYVPQLLAQWLDNDDKVDELLSHGCFCARLDNTNPNFPHLGGQDPLDELDEVCRGWLRSRNCNDNLIGGSCQADRESMRSGAYTMDIVSHDLQISNCGFTNTDCESDTCVIDLMYLKQIAAFFEGNPGFAPTQVTGPGTCSPRHLENVERKCLGEAPDVYPKKMSYLEQLNSRIHWVEDREVGDTITYNDGGRKLNDAKENIELCVRDQVIVFNWPNVKSFTVETDETFNAYHVGWVESGSINNFPPGSADTLGDDTKGGHKTSGMFSGSGTISLSGGLELPAGSSTDFYDSGDTVRVERDGETFTYYVNGALVNSVDLSGWSGYYPAIDLNDRLCVKVTEVEFDHS